MHREMRHKSSRPCLNAGGVFLQQFTLDLKNVALIPHGALVSLTVCEFPNSIRFLVCVVFFSGTPLISGGRRGHLFDHHIKSLIF